MTSKYSDIISHSILAILRYDPRRIVFIRERLFGQRLPNKLRQFIWTECLIHFERKTSDYNLVKQFVLFFGKFKRICRV